MRKFLSGDVKKDIVIYFKIMKWRELTRECFDFRVNDKQMCKRQ